MEVFSHLGTARLVQQQVSDMEALQLSTEKNEDVA